MNESRTQKEQLPDDLLIALDELVSAADLVEAEEAEVETALKTVAW